MSAKRQAERIVELQRKVIDVEARDQGSLLLIEQICATRQFGIGEELAFLDIALRLLLNDGCGIDGVFCSCAT